MSEESTCTRSSCRQPPPMGTSCPTVDICPFPRRLVYRREVISTVLWHLSTRGNTDISLFIFPPPNSCSITNGKFWSKGQNFFCCVFNLKTTAPGARDAAAAMPCLRAFSSAAWVWVGARVGEKGKGQGKGQDRGVCSLFKLKRREKESPASFKVG